MKKTIRLDKMKTLKDCKTLEEAKQLTIKWVKEELRIGFKGIKGSQLNRWMERLNIELGVIVK